MIEFDLVLIPVNPSEWTLSKNANRLLKCVALGVPFLASKTPEHIKTVSELGMSPETFLVDADEDWKSRIEEFQQNYDLLVPKATEARTEAFAKYGLDVVTANWLKNVIGVSKTSTCISLSTQEQKDLRELDVIMLNLNQVHHLQSTVESLLSTELEYNSISIISALPIGTELTVENEIDRFDQHDDFFAVYDSLAGRMALGSGSHTLLLNSGIELRRGFFSESLQTLTNSDICLFRPQLGAEDFSRTPAPPEFLYSLLLEPYIPQVIGFSNSLLKECSGIDPDLGPLAIWEIADKASTTLTK